jgi:hypothetical protein
LPGQSNTTLQQIVDDAMSSAELAPCLATGGWSDQPALRVANTTMTSILLGGPNGQPLNWKFNRANCPPFPTISWQQDYFVPSLVNLGWLESCWANQFTNTSQPKPKFQMECHKDLTTTYNQTGYPGKVCWMPNSLLLTGTWGATELQTITGQNNPGPGAVYTNPLTTINQPNNPITQITDPNGNLWVVTTYGTCGNTQPVWTNPTVYPTFINQTISASTVADGTVVWTAVNPNGQGFRLSPIPPQQGCVWTINPIYQMRILQFTSLQQTLDPLPDDYVDYFRDGFFCQLYRRSPDPKVRAKFTQEWALWLRSLDMAVRQGSREELDFGFVPSSAGVMETGYGGGYLGPAYPFAGGPYGWY